MNIFYNSLAIAISICVFDLLIYNLIILLQYPLKSKERGIEVLKTISFAIIVFIMCIIIGFSFRGYAVRKVYKNFKIFFPLFVTVAVIMYSLMTWAQILVEKRSLSRADVKYCVYFVFSNIISCMIVYFATFVNVKVIEQDERDRQQDGVMIQDPFGNMTMVPANTIETEVQRNISEQTIPENTTEEKKESI